MRTISLLNRIIEMPYTIMDNIYIININIDNYERWFRNTNYKFSWGYMTDDS